MYSMKTPHIVLGLFLTTTVLDAAHAMKEESVDIPHTPIKVDRKSKFFSGMVDLAIQENKDSFACDPYFVWLHGKSLEILSEKKAFPTIQKTLREAFPGGFEELTSTLQEHLKGKNTPFKNTNIEMEGLIYQSLDPKSRVPYSDFSEQEQEKISQALKKLGSDIKIDGLSSVVAVSNLFLSWKWNKYFDINKPEVDFYPEALTDKKCKILDEISKEKGKDFETCYGYALTPKDKTTYLYTDNEGDKEVKTIMIALPTTSEYQFYTIKMTYDQEESVSTLSAIDKDDLKMLFQEKNKKKFKTILPETFEEIEIDCRKLFPQDPFLSGEQPFAYKNKSPVDLLLFQQNIKMDIDSEGGEVVVKQQTHMKARGISRKEKLPEVTIDHPYTYQLTFFTTFDRNPEHAFPVCQGFENGTLTLQKK